ncbi:hypothetical protein KAM338_48160 [Aeromonas caviae]|nr:hypothetical protein KAM330_27610 [Aeromonas hydrophila]GKQ64639.1 hypothetical protein KAM338_48160 [Aeromonas caviae]
MVVLGNVAELVQDDVIDTLARRFDEVWVKRDPAMGGTAPPQGDDANKPPNTMPCLYNKLNFKD